MEYFILNEHSLPIRRDIEDRCLKQFFEIYKEAVNSNFRHIIVSTNLDPHWYEIPISEGRTIRSWINDQARDYATRVKSMIQNIERPIVKIEDIKGPHVCKFYYNKEVVPLLAATYLLKQLALSFDSNDIWNKSFFSLQCQELVDGDRKVNNVTTIEHWILHLKQVSEYRKNQALSSGDIENGINMAFHHIIFAPDASKQLKNEQSQVFLREIWDACKELNEVMEKASGQVSYEFVIREVNLEITDESFTVKKNDKLKRYRMKMYNGNRLFFGHHIKNFTGSNRVHFIINDNKIVIGYLGRHLPL